MVRSEGLRFGEDERNCHTHTRNRLKKEWAALIQVTRVMERASVRKFVQRTEIILDRNSHVHEARVGLPSQETTLH